MNVSKKKKKKKKTTPAVKNSFLEINVIVLTASCSSTSPLVKKHLIAFTTDTPQRKQ
jgi:hypothetical protein